MNALSLRLVWPAVLAMSVLLSACGPSTPPASVPIDGTGGSGGGGSPSGSTGASSTPVAVRSHNPGQNCMACHVTGGTGAASGIFTVAGTIFRSDGSAQMRATVVLNVHATNTPAISLTTDGLGNFWTTAAVPTLVPAAGQQFAVGADVVVTTSGGSRQMAGVITNGSCNSCHGPGGGTGKVTAQFVAQPGVPATVAQIAAGGQHSCVVRTDGAVLCWGTAGGTRSAPALVAALGDTRISSDEQSIAAGDNHTCAIAAGDGHVLCWGANESGQLGNGTTAAASLSTPGITGATALSAVGDSTCALAGAGEQADIYCWGKVFHHDASSGQQVPEIFATAQRVTADATGSLPDAAMQLLHPGVRALDQGAAYSCALLDADPASLSQDVGAVECWGNYTGGASGSGIKVDLGTATPLLAREISLGQNQSCAIDVSGLVKCWGDIEFTHTGTGLVPLQSVIPIPGLEATQFVHIATGADYGCGITVAHGVQCWGNNDAGQLGPFPGTTSPSLAFALQ